MHPKYKEANDISNLAIEAALDVHRHFGPGLLESIYEWALTVDLRARGLSCEKQKLVRIQYKGAIREESLRCDLLINNCLLIEIKAVEGIDPAHKAQALSYMQLLDVPLGLILNFHAPLLRNGISRMILKTQPVLL